MILYAVCATPAGPVAGAFAAEGAGGFVVPFDLVASAFALLSCWDEATCPTRDEHGRLPLDASLFGTNSVLDVAHPVVDRYVELLRQAVSHRLRALGETPLAAPGWMWRGGRGPGFAVALTHDVDRMWRWTPRGFAAVGVRGARAALHRDGAGLRRELAHLRTWSTHHLPHHTDPFWTFPQLLGGENARGVRSTFYFIARHTHRRDGPRGRDYDHRLPGAIELLNAESREVGVHGNDADRLSHADLRADRGRLEALVGRPVIGIRYHYLRCLYHETLPLLEKAGIEYDTSLAFAEHEGFRCGASFPFHPYSLDEERPLRLVELPLAVMDTSLANAKYRGLDATAGECAARAVLEHVRRAGGGISILWHNDRFDPESAAGWDWIYWHLVEAVGEQGGWAAPADEIVARWRERIGKVHA